MTKKQKKEGTSTTLQTMDEKSIRALISEVETGVRYLIDVEGVNAHLTAKERQRLISAGVRNNGFIDKAFDIAIDNPQFIPYQLTAEGLSRSGTRFDELRQLMLVSQQLQRLATDAFIGQSDISYHEALRVYGNLREQTKGRIPGAAPLFEALGTFFRRRRRGSSGFDMEPKAENEAPNTSGNKETA